MNIKIPAMVLALLIMGACMGTAVKVDLNGIDVTLSETQDEIGDDSLTTDVGTKFYVHLNLQGPDKDQDSSDLDIEITVGDVVVYDKTKTVDFSEDEDSNLTISSDEFNEDDAWKDNIMTYYCGRKTLEVTVSGDIRTKRSGEADIKYEGDTLKVELDPSRPTVSDQITVHVTNEDDDDLGDMNVKFTLLENASEWSSEDETFDGTTNDNGEKVVKLSREFSDDPYGTYQIDVWEKDGTYCKETLSLDVSHKLTLGSPDPSNPSAGQSIKVRVTDETGKGVPGAKVTISKPGGPSTYTTDSGGYAVFQISETGTFELIASKGSYTESATQKVTVENKGALKIDVSPASPEVGKDVEIRVLGADGNALTNAKVSISRPDGVIEDPITTQAGKITYNVKYAGTYKLKADAPLYAQAKDEFIAYNNFKVIVTGSLVPGADITATVQDMDGKPVYGAAVSVKGTSVSGSTDSTGKYTFSLTEPKDYTITVKKDSFKDVTQTITIKGTLSLRISSRELKVGDKLEWVLKDSQGNSVTATLKVMEPSGEEESVTDSFKPEQPGAYTLTATKPGYDSASDSFTVTQYQLTLKSNIDSGKIVVTAMSQDSPVPNLTVSFDAGSFHDEVKTDNNGKASIGVKNISGNVTISATDPSYEKTTVVQELKPNTENSSMLLIILAALVIIVIAILAFTTRGQGKNRKEKGMLYRTAGSHLDGRY